MSRTLSQSRWSAARRSQRRFSESNMKNSEACNICKINRVQIVVKKIDKQMMTQIFALCHLPPEWRSVHLAFPFFHCTRTESQADRKIHKQIWVIVLTIITKIIIIINERPGFPITVVADTQLLGCFAIITVFVGFIFVGHALTHKKKNDLLSKEQVRVSSRRYYAKHSGGATIKITNVQVA